METTPLAPIDMHVHLVGNGKRGSGCWLRLAWTRKPLAKWMSSHIGMPVSFDNPGWDETYVAHLVKLVRESSMSCHAITNVIERDYQLKRAWGFPDEHLTRVHDILRKPASVA